MVIAVAVAVAVAVVAAVAVVVVREVVQLSNVKGIRTVAVPEIILNIIKLCIVLIVIVISTVIIVIVVVLTTNRTRKHTTTTGITICAPTRQCLQILATTTIVSLAALAS